MMLRYLLLAPLTLSALLACNPNTETTKPKPSEDMKAIKTVAETASSQTENIVAKIGNQSIELQELDTAIQFSLFDLEWRKYQIRKDMLSRMVAQRQQLLSKESTESPSSEILLTPPEAPRIVLARDKRPVKGKQDAAILISVFCSYQSSHCARLQPIIQQLETHYGETIAFSFYDLPQGFHRYGIAAANAYHCAETAGSPWAYQSALYSDTSKLDKQRFINIAEQLGLDLNAFESCLDESRYLVNIKADIDMATKLGLGSVPVIFINGLYAKGPQDFDAYRYYVDQELTQLGHAHKPLDKPKKEQKLIVSQLPIFLLATTVSNNEKSSTALLKLPESEHKSLYKVGDQLLEHVKLVKIEAQRILINNQGQREFVKLQTSIGHDITTVTTSDGSMQMPTEAFEAEPSYNEERHKGEMKQRELPVTGEMVLSKDWLETQLINQTQLEQHFYLADHVVEGHHLVKLDEITDQRFYNTLGFKTGDVLLRVNDQWVHEGQNPLWDSLAKTEKVSVVLMRGGFPVRYDYNIQ